MSHADSLQYNTNLYRKGGLNLPNRMVGILGMSTKPDFIEVITWVRGKLSNPRLLS